MHPHSSALHKSVYRLRLLLRLLLLLAVLPTRVGIAIGRWTAITVLRLLRPRLLRLRQEVGHHLRPLRRFLQRLLLHLHRAVWLLCIQSRLQVPARSRRMHHIVPPPSSRSQSDCIRNTLGSIIDKHILHFSNNSPEGHRPRAVKEAGWQWRLCLSIHNSIEQLPARQSPQPCLQIVLSSSLALPLAICPCDGFDQVFRALHGLSEADMRNSPCFLPLDKLVHRDDGGLRAQLEEVRPAVA